MTTGRMAAICACEERRTLRDLVGLRVPVARRPALHDVGDVDLLARESHRLDDLREQLPGASDKRLALLVLVGAGPSPTNIRRASGLPTPKTMLVRPACSLQRVQSPMSARMTSAARPAPAPGAAPSQRSVAQRQMRSRPGRQVRAPAAPAARQAGSFESAVHAEILEDSAGGRRGRGVSLMLRPRSRLDGPATARGDRQAPRRWRPSARGARAPRASAPMIVTALASTSKPAVGPRHVVGDDHVDALAHALGPRASRRRPRSPRQSRRAAARVGPRGRATPRPRRRCPPSATSRSVSAPSSCAIFCGATWSGV